MPREDTRPDDRFVRHIQNARRKNLLRPRLVQISITGVVHLRLDTVIQAHHLDPVLRPDHDTAVSHSVIPILRRQLRLPQKVHKPQGDCVIQPAIAFEDLVSLPPVLRALQFLLPITDKQLHLPVQRFDHPHRIFRQLVNIVVRQVNGRQPLQKHGHHHVCQDHHSQKDRRHQHGHPCALHPFICHKTPPVQHTDREKIKHQHHTDEEQHVRYFQDPRRKIAVASGEGQRQQRLFQKRKSRRQHAADAVQQHEEHHTAEGSHCCQHLAVRQRGDQQPDAHKRRPQQYDTEEIAEEKIPKRCGKGADQGKIDHAYQNAGHIQGKRRQIFPPHDLPQRDRSRKKRLIRVLAPLLRKQPHRKKRQRQSRHHIHVGENPGDIIGPHITKLHQKKLPAQQIIHRQTDIPLGVFKVSGQFLSVNRCHCFNPASFLTYPDFKNLCPP